MIRKSKINLLFLSFMLPLAAKATIVTNYNYPYKSSAVATATAAIAKPAVKPQTGELVARPERDDTPIIGDKNKVYFDYYTQAGPAPLVFVIPGNGGTSSDGLVRALAEGIYQQGFNTVTVDDPMSWRFALTVSATGLVGYVPDDTRDLYQLMQQIRTQLQNQGMKITSTMVVGYSLGAVYAGNIKSLDDSMKEMGITKAIMINPPLDFQRGTQLIDSTYASGSSWSKEDKDNIRTTALGVGMQLLERPMSPTYYLGLDQALPLSDSQIMWLMGDQFHSALTDIILTSQRITDVGILKTPESQFRRDARAFEAAQYSFSDYTQKFVLPYLSKTTARPTEKLIADCDLRGLKETFKRSAGYYIMHNSNDFLIQKGDIEWIESTFGSRARVYPTGGHVGNIWYVDNLRQIGDWLKN